MRTGALATIIACELLILIPKDNMNAGSLAFMSTLVVVVLVAFTLSALLRNFKKLTLTRNYMVSGVSGVVAGVFYYVWAQEHFDAMVAWLQKYSNYYLLLFIFICAALLYVYKGPKKAKPEDETPVIEEPVGESM